VPNPPHILIIGGGISGLACAFRLQAMNLPVLLVERAARVGGVIDTVEKDGFRFDVGPQSFLSTPALESFFAELNLSGELLRAPRRAPRYILQSGKLVAAPLSPPALVTTSLFSLRTKLRILTEPLRRTHPPESDESVAAFIRRKFGEDLLANLVAPFISGIYAGDPEWLSLSSAFPQLRSLEAEHGSVIRGFIKAARARKGPRTRPQLSTFCGGLSTFTRAIAARLGDNLRTGCDVAMIRRGAPGEHTGFSVALGSQGSIEPLRISAIVLAIPTDQAARLLAPIDGRFAETFQRIDYAPVVEIGMGYRIADISNRQYRERGGFGFLAPRSEGLRSLGTVWTSTLFPGRAPEGLCSFTTFMGGATDPGIRLCSDAEILATAQAELSGVLGISAQPVATHLARWDRALPQYNIGHGEIVRSLTELCADVPGLFLTGNYLSGPSIGACVEQANKVAESVAEFCRRTDFTKA
jgi:oxygen-dependent protoporphyrinogen oxidase